jgi:hypothetical protein
VVHALQFNQVRNGGMHEQIILAQGRGGLCGNCGGG